jgi:hypothetical protein
MAWNQRDSTSFFFFFILQLSENVHFIGVLIALLRYRMNLMRGGVWILTHLGSAQVLAKYRVSG